MKICAIICEFNPFHNGHKYLIEMSKKLITCDIILCIMNGQFTQRGEISNIDKYLRAKHAILGGADVVAELPASFATSPAEVFASGAISLLNGIDADITLAFGCESGIREEFLKTASALNDESERFKELIKSGMNNGDSYIKSYSSALSLCGGNSELVSSPNNLLGIEYCKAILRGKKRIDICPIKRVGESYDSDQICGEFSSANAIRSNASSPLIRSCMPDYSYCDFVASTDKTERFEQLAADRLFTCSTEDLKRIYGCTEGLENRLKKLIADNGYSGVIEGACSKRYTRARIKRILASNLLGLYADETEEFLKADLPLKLLAVKKERADEILPVLTRDGNASPLAQRCEAITSRAYSLWSYLNQPSKRLNPNEKMILV